jgi:hypothetical protein
LVTSTATDPVWVGPKPPAAGWLDGLRVLVVDGEADGRRLIGKVPADVGARIIAADSALLCGFQVHIRKPVDAYELITLVASLAGRTA